MRGAIHAWAIATLTIGALACDSGPTGVSPIDRIDIESGNGQSAQAGTTLSSPVVAQVYREDGTEALFVLWVEMPGEGTLDLGGARGSGSGVLLQSPDMGTASVTWTLGNAPGPQQLRFFAVRAPGDTVEAIATAEALAPR